MPIHIQTFLDGKELFEHLKGEVYKKISSNELELLRDFIKIYTRETVTSEFYSMKFANEDIPSLKLDIQKASSAWRSYVEYPATLEIINRTQAIFSLYTLLKKD
ncbi:MAG: hypothetical protein KDK36_04995, partial [Leptospiraceae bacterium]|nr:hypothetical protein [Leptospiraceae bacterium]